MNNTARHAVATIGTLAATASLLAVAPAQSAELAGSRITVRASDYTVSSGEQFRLRGFLTSEGTPLEDATVRVKTYRNGEWVRLPGAFDLTNDEGRYGIRIILQMKGQRQLRVIGDPKGDDIRNARRDIVVTVR